MAEEASLAPRRVAAPPKRFVRQQVPDSILNDPRLRAAIARLPSNYNLEIPKTVWRIKQAGARRVALQLPEGLQMFALPLCDILEEFAAVEECFVLGDVTYGACCIDDLTAAALGADFLVHYGHSCLVPIDVTQVPSLYVFVDIQIDVEHMIEALKFNFEAGSRLALCGTIQFSSAIHSARMGVVDFFSEVVVPQAKPLSAGEVLGCTAPAISKGSVDAAVFVADGRFHLEAFMIANPGLKVYRYDPYTKALSNEEYDQAGMRKARRAAIEQAQRGKSWGVILGTLGRQGNPQILRHLENRLAERGVVYKVFLMSEMSPAKIGLLEETIDAWIQIACPRLSIDWGEAYGRPLLTPYEAEVALGFTRPWWKRCSPGNEGHLDCSSSCCSCGDKDVLGDYPMDYYARDGGPWNSVYNRKPTKARS
ncbi:hypothetical protein SELMODRAFT_156702 [Selaginella moellendorffii]|uniref:2-(3-amino-3-carboxypropyl)histidine synthase subunit 1 n=1 Tax=Selaginella moellendorffii TaxID=88036 RepID=D8SMP1_SELML|nr:hypothetical protein SELMODRAFT_156702 [Selaginella moellendorffii]